MINRGDYVMHVEHLRQMGMGIVLWRKGEMAKVLWVYPGPRPMIIQTSRLHNILR